MSKITLRLTLSDAEPSPTAAWLIPGGEPAGWIAEVVRWRVPAESLALFVVPESIRSRHACGLLVVPNQPVHPRQIIRAIPYACRARRLYLPVHARLSPPIVDAELHQLLAWHVALFHPAAGLVGFTADDALRVTDLITPPVARRTGWMTTATSAGPPRLTSVEVEMPPTVETLIEQGRGDIGSEAEDGAPPAAGEPGDGLADKIARGVAKPFAGGINWFASTGLGKVLGGSAAGKAFGDWAQKSLAGTSSADEFLRNKELNRLLERLKNDPDEGLKFALPMAGINQGRGIARPGNRLGMRDTGFNLSRLFGGGGRGDAWNIERDMQQKLLAQYRESANRELRLRRFHRAAYIFAELLGDFGSAANALKQGRLFREAAILYKEKLKRPREAADCLAEGGLLLEAIPIYIEQGDFLRAGELYETLGRLDEARAQFRREVERLHQYGDPLKAAALLEQRLDLPDEALAILAATWPSRPQAGPCLVARLAMLDRLSRLDESRALLQSLREDSAQRTAMVVTMIQALGETAAQSPRPEVRRHAGDVIRVIAGRRLPHVSISQATQLVQQVRKLDENDRLLGRDTQRFLRPAAAVIQNIGRRKNTDGPALVRKITLPTPGPSSTEPDNRTPWRITAVTSDERAIWATSMRGKELDVASIDWASGLSEHVAFTLADNGRIAPAHMLLTPKEVLVTLEGTHTPLPMRAMTTAVGKMAKIGEPPGMSDIVSGWCSLGLMLWLISWDKDLRPGLTLQWTDGNLINRRTFDFLDGIDSPDDVPWMPMLAQPGVVYVAANINGGIYAIGKDLVVAKYSTKTPVRAMHGSRKGGPTHAVAVLADGGVVLQHAGPQLDGIPFAHDMADPIMGFTGGGVLVAVTPTQGRVYRITETGAVLLHSFDPPTRNPTAVLLGPTVNEFAIVDNDITAYLMRLP